MLRQVIRIVPRESYLFKTGTLFIKGRDVLDDVNLMEATNVTLNPESGILSFSYNSFRYEFDYSEWDMELDRIRTFICERGIEHKVINSQRQPSS